MSPRRSRTSGLPRRCGDGAPCDRPDRVVTGRFRAFAGKNALEIRQGTVMSPIFDGMPKDSDMFPDGH